MILALPTLTEEADGTGAAAAGTGRAAGAAAGAILCSCAAAAAAAARVGVFFGVVAAPRPGEAAAGLVSGVSRPRTGVVGSAPPSRAGTADFFGDDRADAPLTWSSSKYSRFFFRIR